MQNVMQIPPRGASRQMGEIYAKICGKDKGFSNYQCQGTKVPQRTKVSPKRKFSDTKVP